MTPDQQDHFQFEPDEDLDWWLNMLDREVIFEPENLPTDLPKEDEPPE